MDTTWLSRDEALYEEIQARISAREISILDDVSIVLDTIDRVRESGRPLSPHDERESIILEFGRPALFVRNNTFEVPRSNTWLHRLNSVRESLDNIIPAVGRVEVHEHSTYDWIGTGWLVRDNIIVTNRHVAEQFAKRNETRFEYKINHRFKRMQASIDFFEEYRVPDSSEYAVVGIEYIATDDEPDVAFLRISVDSPSDTSLASPIPLATDIPKEFQQIVVIGYPARDGRIPEPEVMSRIFGGIYNVKRLAPGEIISVTDLEITHDCSTLGGNSGSVLVNLVSGEAVGLHFAGSYKRGNYAVPAATVKEMLEMYVK